MQSKKSFAGGWKAGETRLVVLIILQAIGGGTAGAQGTAPPKLGEEITKQEKIYRSRGPDVPSGYITSRSLSNYVEVLPTGFIDALGKLGPADRWLDIGAGSGQAILDYYVPDNTQSQGEKRVRPTGKAQAVAVSIEDRRSDTWRQRAAEIGEDRMRYVFGKRLRDYSREELGKFQIVTDVFGGFSYTDDLSRFMEKLLGFMEVNGSFYTLVQSVHLEDGKDNPRTWYLTEIVDPAGRDVKVCGWLKSIGCVKVTCDSKSTWDAPTELIHVSKVCEDVSVPPLKPLFYEAGNPPGRKFQLAQ